MFTPRLTKVGAVGARVGGAIAAAALSAVVVAALAGCGPKPVKRACMGAGGGDDPLLTGAAILRLDVYGSDVHCDGAQLAGGAGAPIMSHTYAQGEPIKLDIPPGPHTLLLTTFADAAGTMALGQGCTEADLTAGGQLCFDLTLAPAPDAGSDMNVSMCTVVPNSCPAGYYCDGVQCQSGCNDDNDCKGSPDGGVSSTPYCDATTHRCVPCVSTSQCPAGRVCSGNQCVAGCPTGQKLCNGSCISSESCCTAADCTAPPSPGACYDGVCATPGGSCSYTLKSGAQVCGSTCCLPINGTCSASCTLSCAAGMGDCNNDPTDGCETPTTTTANCGACGRACSTTNVATASCTNGLCTSTCTSPWGNCSTPAAPTPDDGCETNLGTNADNCGACGRACSGTNVATRSCLNGLCNSSCNAGSGNCNEPAAPAADDGCEDNTTIDPANCGACNKACTAPPNESATCANSMCGSTCNSGFSDCDASSTNGCECKTDPAAPACCGSGCQTVHNNGWGGNYFDCSPLGQPGVTPTTYTSTMANEAAASYTAQTGTSSGGWHCGSTIKSGGSTICDPAGNCTLSICKTAGNGSNGTCTCWVIDATGTYNTRIGHTYHSSGVGGDSGCLCPFDTDPSWN